MSTVRGVTSTLSLRWSSIYFWQYEVYQTLLQRFWIVRYQLDGGESELLQQPQRCISTNVEGTGNCNADHDNKKLNWKFSKLGLYIKSTRELNACIFITLHIWKSLKGISLIFQFSGGYILSETPADMLGRVCFAVIIMHRPSPKRSKTRHCFCFYLIFCVASYFSLFIFVYTSY